LRDGFGDKIQSSSWLIKGIWHLWRIQYLKNAFKKILTKNIYN
jgi:hypothetical protein